MGILAKISAAFRRGGKSPAQSVHNEPMVTPVDPRRVPYIALPTRQAGVFVDHDTAMTVGAVFRAVSFISQSVAMLPWVVQRESEGRRIKLTNHPVWKLIQVRANPEMSNYSWEETMVAWACSWGNGYSEIEFDKGGRPIALWPIEPYRVRVSRAQDPENGSYLTGPLVYRVTNDVGPQVTIPADRMFHLKGLGFNGLVGYSVVALGARSIGLGIASEQSAEDLFANGSITTGAITHPQKLSPETKEDIRGAFASMTRGHGRRYNIPVFDQGIGWQDLMINPEDAQLLSTRKFQVTDIARWFGLPPHKLMDLERSTFSNIESQNIEVVQDALMPWIVRLEQEADFKLLGARERGVRTKIETRGFLRGDHKTRATYYQIMRNIGVYSANTILRLEDMDPVGPEGDALIMQSSFTTLKAIVGDETVQNGNKQKPPAKPGVLPGKSAALHELEDSEINHGIARFNTEREFFGDDEGLFNAWMEIYTETARERIDVKAQAIALDFIGHIRPGALPKKTLNVHLSSFSDNIMERVRHALYRAFHEGTEATVADMPGEWAYIRATEHLAAFAASLPEPAPKSTPKVVVPEAQPNQTTEPWDSLGSDPHA